MVAGSPEPLIRTAKAPELIIADPKRCNRERYVRHLALSGSDHIMNVVMPVHVGEDETREVMTVMFKRQTKQEKTEGGILYERP